MENILSRFFELKQERLRALNLFPGEKDLEEMVQNGIPWGGKISHEMILSIFWHDNPVHDGAAIVS